MRDAAPARDRQARINARSISEPDLPKACHDPSSERLNLPVLWENALLTLSELRMSVGAQLRRLQNEVEDSRASSWSRGFLAATQGAASEVANGGARRMFLMQRAAAGIQMVRIQEVTGSGANRPLVRSVSCSSVSRVTAGARHTGENLVVRRISSSSTSRIRRSTSLPDSLRLRAAVDATTEACNSALESLPPARGIHGAAVSQLGRLHDLTAERCHNARNSASSAANAVQAQLGTCRLVAPSSSVASKWRRAARFVRQSSEGSTLSPDSDRMQPIRVRSVTTIGPGEQKGESNPVTLHVYDAIQLATAESALPIVHLGIEIFDREFSFGEAGVRSTRPGLYDATKHRRRMLLGHTQLRKREFFNLILQLKKEWPGRSYRLVGNNCQTFAVQLCEHLGLGGCIPENYLYFSKPIFSPVCHLMPQALVNAIGSTSNSCADVHTSSGFKCPASCNSCSDVSEVLEQEATQTLIVDDRPPWMKSPNLTRVMKQSL